MSTVSNANYSRDDQFTNDSNKGEGFLFKTTSMATKTLTNTTTTTTSVSGKRYDKN